MDQGGMKFGNIILCLCEIVCGVLLLKGYNDLQTAVPFVAAQWHPTLNGELTPDMVTYGSHKRIWWKCSEGHVWKAPIYSRTGTQTEECPICARKKERPC